MSTHRPYPLCQADARLSRCRAWRDLERPESFQQESASAGTDEDIQALIAYIRSRLAAGRATVNPPNRLNLLGAIVLGAGMLPTGKPVRADAITAPAKASTVPYGEYIHRDELMSAIPEHSGGIPRERVETFFPVTRLKGADNLETEGTLSSLWDKHVGAEFGAKDADQAVATMTAEAYVNLIPLMIGGRGREGVRDFYATHFLPQLPPDIEIVPVSRTIGQSQVVDELIIRFTHSTRMDWLLPGIAPTGKRVQVPFVAIIRFEGDQIVREHLYWDQASLLVQLDLLDRALPVRGGEIAAQVLDPSQPMNELIHRGGVKSNGTKPKKRARASAA